MAASDLELESLRAENEALREELDELREDLENLRREADLDACHAAGLTAQLKALIAEGDACPNKDAHPLLQRESYVHALTGEAIVKTRAFPLYRQAFDAEAAELRIENPESYRA